MFEANQYKQEGRPRKGISAFLSLDPLNESHPSLIHFSSTPLFRLDLGAEKYEHLIKRKDVEYLAPIIRYFLRLSGHVIYLAGEAAKNRFLLGKKKYKTLNILAILTNEDIERYSSVMNNIISSNDGEFSMGLKYRVKKNRKDGCFKDVAHARYFIEPRLVGFEKILYPLRSSAIELDLTTQNNFSRAFGVEIK